MTPTPPRQSEREVSEKIISLFIDLELGDENAVVNDYPLLRIEISKALAAERKRVLEECAEIAKRIDYASSCMECVDTKKILKEILQLGESQ